MALISLRQLLDHAAAAEVCRSRFEAFGAAGWASRIRPVALEAMAERYLAA